MRKTPLSNQQEPEPDKFDHDINPINLTEPSENCPETPPPFALSDFPPPSGQFTADEDKNG